MASIAKRLKQKLVDAERQERFLAYLGKGLNRIDAATLAGIADIGKVLADDPILKMRTERAQARLKLKRFQRFERHTENDAAACAKLLTMHYPECRGESDGGDPHYTVVFSFQERKPPAPIVQTPAETKALTPPDVPAIIDQSPGGR